MPQSAEKQLESPESLRRVLDALQDARAKLEAVKRKEREPIAIIGMGCRFPGGVNNLERYWQLLENGVDAVTEVPKDRWDSTTYYDVDPEAPGKMYSWRGAFLEKLDAFDAHFFGISAPEAVNLDPQQRMLLEVGWEAIEHAGLSPDQLYGTATGVFLGIAAFDYAVKLCRQVNHINGYLVPGTGLGSAAGRLSYVLGLTGPSMAIDTACSSSLVALHMAISSLRQRECNVVLVGGVHALVEPVFSVSFSKARMLAPDGRCKTFDTAADGYVRGEGCGVMVLKRLADAIADKDNILAVIRGSAVNQDGASGGLTVPSGPSQEAVIRQALARSGIEPHEVSYIEAHGTGTPLGDPIEVGALGRVFGPQRAQPLYLGSVKTNIGHLEAAAGMAGIFKVVLALQHGKLPPHLHLQQPNPRIPWASLPLVIPTALLLWDAAPRIAGVSAFGISGTNAHVILEEAPAPQPTSPSRAWQLLTISGQTITALDQATINLADHLQQTDEDALADVAYTLIQRKAFSHRRSLLVGKDKHDAIAALRTLDPTRVFTQRAAARPPAVIFMFPGQGAQYVQMGRDLYQAEPVFREQVDHCADLLQVHMGLDLRTLLYPSHMTEGTVQQLEQTAIAQPALFVIEYALAQLWMTWGVRPHAMIGHSLGEYVAACLAGVFSLEDALRLVVVRGEMMQQLPRGAMLSVPLTEAEVQPLLWADLTLAAVNSHARCVLAGTVAAVDALHRELGTRGLACSRLRTSHAFHSAMMEPIMAPFTAWVQKVCLQRPQIPYISNLTGTWITDKEATDPTYWANHLRHTVRFGEGLKLLAQNSGQILLEVGPGRTLATLTKRHPEFKHSLVLTSLPHSEEATSDVAGLLTTLGQLWLSGVRVDWSSFYAHEQRRRRPLPTYPFERQRYWPEQAIAEPVAANDHQTQVPRPSITPNYARPPLRNAYVMPRSPLEQHMASVWQNILAVQPIGIHDNFFELGGDSLLATSLVSQLSNALGVEFTPSQLIETPTIAMLASVLNHNGADTPTEQAISPLLKIQRGTTKLPLFCVHPAGGSAISYVGLARHLAVEQPVYGIQAPELYTERTFSFQERAAHYVTLIRAVQPKGPYVLAGHSYGGNLAFEMAVQLQQQGETIALLALLDSFPPVAYEHIHTDETKLLATFWHIMALVFGKEPRNWHAELQTVAMDRQLLYMLEQLRLDKSGQVVPDALLRPYIPKIAVNNFRELHNYQVKRAPLPLLYFCAHEKVPASLNQLLNYQIPDDVIGDGWSHVTSEPIQVIDVPGSHFTMLNEPNVRVLAAAMQKYLAQATIQLPLGAIT